MFVAEGLRFQWKVKAKTSTNNVSSLASINCSLVVSQTVSVCVKLGMNMLLKAKEQTETAASETDQKAHSASNEMKAVNLTS